MFISNQCVMVCMWDGFVGASVSVWLCVSSMYLLYVCEYECVYASIYFWYVTYKYECVHAFIYSCMQCTFLCRNVCLCGINT